MKSECEFMDGVWNSVSEMEREARLLAAAKTEHRKIIVKNIIIYLSVIIFFAFMQMSVLFEIAFIYENALIIMFLILSIAYFIDAHSTMYDLN